MTRTLVTSPSSAMADDASTALPPGGVHFALGRPGGKTMALALCP